MRRLRPTQKARVGEFRLLRGVPLEVNVTRFKAHMRRLRRRLAGDRALCKLKLKARRIRRAAMARRER